MVRPSLHIRGRVFSHHLSYVLRSSEMTSGCWAERSVVSLGSEEMSKSSVLLTNLQRLVRMAQLTNLADVVSLAFG